MVGTGNTEWLFAGTVGFLAETIVELTDAEKAAVHSYLADAFGATGRRLRPR